MCVIRKQKGPQNVLKKIRTLKSLDLVIPISRPLKGENGERPLLPVHKRPLLPALNFLTQVNQMEHEPKRLRFLLLEKHNEIFDAFPNEGVPLEVVKARIYYRLHYEGHRIAGVPLSEKVQQNYKAVMAFHEQPGEWFNGCSREVSELGLRLTTMGGVTSMSAIKKVKTIAKKLARSTSGTAKQVTKKAAGKHRELVLDAFSACESIRYMAKVFNAGAAQIEAALKKLGVKNINPATITIQRSRALTGKLDIPRVTAEQKAKLRAATPANAPKLIKKGNAK